MLWGALGRPLVANAAGPGWDLSWALGAAEWLQARGKPRQGGGGSAEGEVLWPGGQVVVAAAQSGPSATLLFACAQQPLPLPGAAGHCRVLVPGGWHPATSHCHCLEAGLGAAGCPFG